jgi:AbiV family abortive infection protein
MSSKTFLTLPKKECLKVYKDILENSYEIWDEGKILAENNAYGRATSLAIISIEELVKSIIVLADGNGFNLRKIKGINAIFKNHKIRYVLAYSMLVINLFGEEFAKIIKYFKEKPEELVAKINQMQNEKDFFEKNLKNYFFRKFITLKDEFEWFSKADFYRQDGFYCDYKEQLKSPIKITSEDYHQVYLRLDKVRIIARIIIESFETEEKFYKEHIEKLKLDFREKNYYDKIGSALIQINHTNEDPFDFIRKSISSILKN